MPLTITTCHDDLTESPEPISSGTYLLLRPWFTLILFLLSSHVADAQFKFNDDLKELRLRAETLLLDQKYTELDDLIAGIRETGTMGANGGSYLAMLYHELGTPLNSPDKARTTIRDRMQRVQAWSQANQSIAAHIALADCYCDQADRARGTGLAGTVTIDGMRIIDESVMHAEETLRKAASLAEEQGVKDPNIAAMFMRVGMIAGYSRDQMQKYLDESLAIDPWFSAPLNRMCYYLMPRWYGSPGDRAELARECAAAHQQQTGDSAYAIVALQAIVSGDITEFKPDGLPWPRVRQGLRDILVKTPDSPYTLGLLAQMAHIAGDRETARDAIERLEGRWMIGVWKTEVGFQRTVRWAFDDGESGESLRVVELGPTSQTQVCVVNEGKDFVLSNTRFRLPIYSVETGELVKEISTWPKQVRTVAHQSVGKTTDFVLMGDRDYSIERVDLQRETFELIGITDRGARDFVTSENGSGIALGDYDSDIKFWRIEPDPLPYEWSRVFSEQLGGVALSPEGDRLLSGSGRTLKIWDTRSREMLRTWDSQSERVYCLAWSPDGHTLASAGSASDVMLWNADDGREIGRIATGVPDQYILSLAFSPDGTRLIAGTYFPSGSPPPGQVLVCDVAAGKMVKSLAGHRLGVQSVTVTPDGKRILSASEDGSVRIWEMPAE